LATSGGLVGWSFLLGVALGSIKHRAVTFDKQRVEKNNDNPGPRFCSIKSNRI
jgi:hypothetical protein